MEKVFDAPMNMAIDEALLMQAVELRAAAPVIRFYGWQRRAVSIGYFQKIAAVRKILEPVPASFETVRRMTGGGVVFHGNDITFSIVAPERVFANAGGGGGIVESYRKVNEAVMRGIAGIRGADCPGKASLERQSASTRSTKLCFVQPTKYDVMFEGRKVAGGAQRRIGGYILYQGSILLRAEPEKELSALLGPTAATLEDIAGRQLERDVAVRDMHAGFEEVFGLGIVSAEIDAALIERANGLVAEKYGSDDWLNNK